MSFKNKALIFNSDDFGHSHPFNMGVYKGIQSGVITTSCVLSNMEGFSEAVSLKSDLGGIKFGIHLNIVEGKSLTNPSYLTDSQGNFNLGYTEILRKSFDKKFLFEVEKEFRAQIEKTMSNFEINHINSHVHTHSIPNLFKLVKKLALEYKIPYIRTQFEKPYFVKSLKKHLNFRYPINLVKLAVLDVFTLKNKKELNSFLTNDYLIGVTYTGFMDKDTVLEGLKAINKGVVEVLIHPAYYEKEILKPDNYKEFLLTQDPKLIDEIKKLGFDVCGCGQEQKNAPVS